MNRPGEFGDSGCSDLARFGSDGDRRRPARTRSGSVRSWQAVCLRRTRHRLDVAISGGITSRGASVHVTPARTWTRAQRYGDGMVGLLVVSPGVLVGRVVGASDPAAGQAQPELDPVLATGRAPWAAGGTWLDGVCDGDVATRTRLGSVALWEAWSRHRCLECWRFSGGTPAFIQASWLVGETGDTSKVDQLGR